MANVAVAKNRTGTARLPCLPGSGRALQILASPSSHNSYRYDWLQRFVLQFEGNRSLALLPNYAFALPMAAHRRQQEQAGGGGGGGSKAAAERAQPGASSSGSGAPDLSGSSPHVSIPPVSAVELVVGRLIDSWSAESLYGSLFLRNRQLPTASGAAGGRAAAAPAGAAAPHRQAAGQGRSQGEAKVPGGCRYQQ